MKMHQISQLKVILLDSIGNISKIMGNNTPPASRQISAMRGVTCFYFTQVDGKL